MSINPKDRHVLAAAVVARAQIIVTANLRDFPADVLAPFGVEAQSPDTFLTHLLDLAPEKMVQIVRMQAAALRSPLLTVMEMVDHLALHAPTFAGRSGRLIETTRADEGLEPEA